MKIFATMFFALGLVAQAQTTTDTEPLATKMFFATQQDCEIAYATGEFRYYMPAPESLMVKYSKNAKGLPTPGCAQEDVRKNESEIKEPWVILPAGIPAEFNSKGNPKKDGRCNNKIHQFVPLPLPKGEKGDKGDSGLDGTNGRDGRDGLNGRDGRNGIDGKNGRDGRNGKDQVAGGLSGTQYTNRSGMSTGTKVVICTGIGVGVAVVVILLTKNDDKPAYVAPEPKGPTGITGGAFAVPGAPRSHGGSFTLFRF